MVQYVQDYYSTPIENDGSNLFICPDESFEVDLDLNFKEAINVL